MRHLLLWGCLSERRTHAMRCLQESGAQEDYGALLQDSHLLRRDIAQAIEDREIQKVRPVSAGADRLASTVL